MKKFMFYVYVEGADIADLRGEFETHARTLEEAQADFRSWIRRAQATGELDIPDTLDGWSYTCRVNYI